MKLRASYWRLWTASAVSNLGDGISTVAYPWLASAVTRDPIRIAGIAVATRLPWLVFTLPAGVITDPLDRRKLIVAMDIARMLITVGVALAVLILGEDLVAPDDPAAAGSAPEHGFALLTVLYASALLVGFAEVLGDNAAQTILPSIVEPSLLETANGRMWGAEMVMNSFVGPPSAASSSPWGSPSPSSWTPHVRSRRCTDRRHERHQTALADTAGRETVPRRAVRRRSVAVEPPIAQADGDHERDVLGRHGGVCAVRSGDPGPRRLELRALADRGRAIGGVVDSVAASRVSRSLGPGASLFSVLLVGAITLGITGTTSSAPVVSARFVVFSFSAVLWNVITVSLRQTIIPDDLLGRVNRVYRFLAWGMMPIGSILGG